MCELHCLHKVDTGERNLEFGGALRPTGVCDCV